jgi:hypothetical protein
MPVVPKDLRLAKSSRIMEACIAAPGVILEKPAFMQQSFAAIVGWSRDRQSVVVAGFYGGSSLEDYHELSRLAWGAHTQRAAELKAF